MLVQSADLRAFVVGQDREVACARNVIERKLQRRTHVEEFVKLGQVCYGRPVAGQRLVAHVDGRHETLEG